MITMITMMETMITIIILMTTKKLLYDDNDENDDDDDNDEGLSVSREGPLQADMPPVSRYALLALL